MKGASHDAAAVQGAVALIDVALGAGGGGSGGGGLLGGDGHFGCWWWW